MPGRIETNICSIWLHRSSALVTYLWIVVVVQTLCAMLRAIFQKKFSDRSFDMIDVIVGFDSAECHMRVSQQ